MGAIIDTNLLLSIDVVRTSSVSLTHVFAVPGPTIHGHAEAFLVMVSSASSPIQGLIFTSLIIFGTLSKAYYFIDMQCYVSDSQR